MCELRELPSLTDYHGWPSSSPRQVTIMPVLCITHTHYAFETTGVENLMGHKPWGATSRRGGQSLQKILQASQSAPQSWISNDVERPRGNCMWLQPLTVNDKTLYPGLLNIRISPIQRV